MAVCMHIFDRALLGLGAAALVLAATACGDDNNGGSESSVSPTSVSLTNNPSGVSVTVSGSESESDTASSTANGGSESGSDSNDAASNASNSNTSDDTSNPFTTGDSSSPTSGFEPDCDGVDNGCGKVDFLFVIDNSGSMGDNQDNLIASFPGFITTLATTLPNDDYHIMVVDTDAGQQLGSNQCKMQCEANPDLEFCNVFIPPYSAPCNPPLTECDEWLGAGVNFPTGGGASNYFCDFFGGNRYIISEEPSLATKFQCAAKVGDDGDGSERPAEAMVSALSFDLNKPGACNEAFLRDDALLVITIITDEPDTNSNGIPAGWYANIVSAKKGDETRVVVLGLLTDPLQPNPVCSPEHAPAPQLREFINSFTYGSIASVCAANYGPFFQQAVSVIDTACCEFTPPV